MYNLLHWECLLSDRHTQKCSRLFLSNACLLSHTHNASHSPCMTLEMHHTHNAILSVSQSLERRCHSIPVGEKSVSLQEIRSEFEFVPGLFGIVLRGGYVYRAWPCTVLILIESKFIVPEL